MKRAISLSFIIVGALALSGRAPATTIFLSATIDGAQANMGAGTGSPGTGSGQVALDGVSNLLSWNVTWSGLLGDVIAAHFHGPAPAGQDAGVEVGLVDLTTPSMSQATLTDTQKADLLAGLWYINIHTTVNPGGEIRGQVVPEPSTLLLVAAGAGFLLVLRRRTAVR